MKKYDVATSHTKERNNKTFSHVVPVITTETYFSTLGANSCDPAERAYNSFVELLPNS